MGLQIRPDEASVGGNAGHGATWSCEHRRLLVAVHRLGVRGWRFAPTRVGPDVDGLLGAMALSPYIEDSVCVWGVEARGKRVHTMTHPDGFDVVWDTSGSIAHVVHTLLCLPLPPVTKTEALRTERSPP